KERIASRQIGAGEVLTTGFHSTQRHQRRESRASASDSAVDLEARCREGLLPFALISSHLLDWPRGLRHGRLQPAYKKAPPSEPCRGLPRWGFLFWNRIAGR